MIRLNNDIIMEKESRRLASGSWITKNYYRLWNERWFVPSLSLWHRLEPPSLCGQQIIGSRLSVNNLIDKDLVILQKSKPGADNHLVLIALFLLHRDASLVDPGAVNGSTHIDVCLIVDKKA